MNTQEEIKKIDEDLEKAFKDLQQSENVHPERGLVNYRVVSAKMKIRDAQRAIKKLSDNFEEPEEIIPIHTPRFKEDPMPKIEKHLGIIAEGVIIYINEKFDVDLDR